MMWTRVVCFGMAAIAALLGACASPQQQAGRGAAAVDVLRLEIGDARAVPIFDRSGQPASWGDMLAAAAGTEAVLVGENHGHPLGLASAATFWQDLLGLAPEAGLALEFFERDDQAALDDYLSGVTDEKAFAAAAKLTPSKYPPGHQRMVETAKANGRPVWAANAPRRYVRLARTQDFERLRAMTPEQRRLFRVPDEIPRGSYYEEFVEVMMAMGDSDAKGGVGGGAGAGEAGTSGAGGAGEKAAVEPDAERRGRIDAMFRSQSTWDWTMAESVARSIEAGNVPTLLVVGRFHVDRGGGTVQALERQRPGTRIVTISFVDASTTSVRPEDLGRADYVIYVGK